tara:strand:+ start:6267 stop:6557 length:291 start_codon:yes stop_codon:yes gene_type:complete
MTTYLYKTYGGYYYKLSGGKAKRISYDEFKCDYEIGKTIVHKGDKVRIKIKKMGIYNTKAEGIVADVLTSKRYHSRGKKVRLTTGEIGRVICVCKS